MKAITTRFLGPTDFRGARIRASEPDGKSITIPYDHGLNTEEHHLKAARALCKRLGWTGRLRGGATRKGYVFVFI
jgi:hypothetical protein